jgi:hypothetical protein
MLDIRALQRGTIRESEKGIRVLLAQFLRKIVEERQDWNGEIITLRESDLATVSLLLAMEKTEIVQWLATSGILLQKKRG